MEVAVGGPGGRPVTPASTDEDRSRVRLNIALYAVIVVCVCLALLVGLLMWNARDESVRGVDVVPGAGQDVGRGIVQAVELADEAEQERVAAQLAAASTMVDAFVNLDYKDTDKTIDGVRAQATGDFLKQYEKGAAGLERLATEAESTMVAEVVWAGLVAGDDDSATVIVATSGTVTNKTTDFKQESRNYRLQLELVLEDDRWLTADLQFVELG